jgi:hypothetical protein
MRLGEVRLAAPFRYTCWWRCFWAMSFDEWPHGWTLFGGIVIALVCSRFTRERKNALKPTGSHPLLDTQMESTYNAHSFQPSWSGIIIVVV